MKIERKSLFSSPPETESIQGASSGYNRSKFYCIYAAILTMLLWPCFADFNSEKAEFPLPYSSIE